MLKKRPLCVVLVSVIFTWIVAFFLDMGFNFCLLLISFGGFLSLVWIKKTRRFSCLVLLTVSLSFLYHIAFTYCFVTPMRRFENKEIELEGKVISERKEGINSQYFIIRPDVIRMNGDEYKPCGKAIVYYDKEKYVDVQIGCQVICSGQVFEVGTDEGYAIDYRLTQGEFISMNGEEFRYTERPDDLDISVVLERGKQKIISHFDRVFNPQTSGVITAIVLGDKSYIDPLVYRNFKDSGVSHTMAVSGMHLTFLSGILWYLFAILSKNLYLRAVLQLICIWVFTAFTGFSPSCLRAAIMLSLFQIGILLKKESDTYTALSVAVFLIIVTNPYSVFDVGLSLSATATFGIVLLSPYILKLFPKMKRPKSILGKLYGFLKNTIAMSLAATVGTLPIMILMFRTVSLLSPITNVLIIFAVEILFSLGFIAVALGWFAPIGSLLSLIGDGLMFYCTKVTSFVSSLSCSVVYTQSIEFWIAFGTVVLCCVVIFLLWRKRVKVLFVSYSLLFCAVFVALAVFDWYNRDVISVNFVDVGQGNATVICNQHAAVIIDCGGTGDGYDEILKVLEKHNVRSISSVFVTHFDNDHTKYFSELADDYKIQTFYGPSRDYYNENGAEILGITRTKNIQTKLVRSDQTIDLWNKAKINCFTKHMNFGDTNENENSLVLQFVYGEHEVLFSGDIDKDNELELSNFYGDKLKSDVLVVAHHGSKGSSLDDFLFRVDPFYAVISCDDNNVYGFPHKQAMDTIRRNASSVLITGTAGTIEFKLDVENLELKE